MNPKHAWDIILPFAGGAGLVAGLIGFAVGASAYDPYCAVVTEGGGPIQRCTREGGESLGLFFTSAERAGFSIGILCAIVVAAVAGWYKDRETRRKASLAAGRPVQ